MTEIERSDRDVALSVTQDLKSQSRLSHLEMSLYELCQPDCLIRIQHRIVACRAARLAGLAEGPKDEPVSKTYWQKHRQEKTAIKQRTVLIRALSIELERHVLQSSGAETLQDADPPRRKRLGNFGRGDC